MGDSKSAVGSIGAWASTATTVVGALVAGGVLDPGIADAANQTMSGLGVMALGLASLWGRVRASRRVTRLF